MVDFSAQAKVGLVLVIAILMVLAGLRLIEKNVKGQTYSVDVTFDDAHGLGKGVDVRLMGVLKGTVTGVDSNSVSGLAVVHIKFRKDALVPDDALFIASEEGMVSEKVINVRIPTDSKREWVKNGHVFKGVFSEGFNELLVKGNRLMDKVEETLTKISATVDPTLISDTMVDISTKLKDSMDKVNLLLTHIDSIVGTNADEVHDTLTNLKDMTENFKLVSSDIRKVTNDPVLLARLDNITHGLEESVASMQKISADIEEVTGDPEVKQNLKDSVRLTKETLEEAKGSITEFRGTLSDVNRKIDKVSKFSDFDVSGRVIGRWVHEDTPLPGDDKDKALADVEVQMDTKKGFIRIGTEGIGEDSILNLQGGRNITPDLAMRGGVVRSKVGVGVDYRMGHATWTTDVYDPNDTKVNSYLGFRLNKDYTLRLGVEDVFGDTHPMAGVAFEF